MDITMVFAVLAGVFFATYLVTTILIINFLEKRKVKINYWLIRFLMPKYAQKYKEIKIEETGEPGDVYSLWTISLVLMLISTAAAIITIVSR
jgi:hypothetical protein